MLLLQNNPLIKTKGDKPIVTHHQTVSCSTKILVKYYHRSQLQHPWYLVTVLGPCLGLLIKPKTG